MHLRQFRQYHWENTSDMIGGLPQWSLRSYDTLQYLNDKAEWVDVPTVEDEQPQRPDLALMQQRNEEFQEWVDDHTEAIKEAVSKNE